MMDNIIEGNKLIAFFMEAKWEKDSYEDFGFHWEIGKQPTHESSCWWSAEGLRYHKDWNWLIPAVEKIYLNRFVKDISIRPGRVRIWMQNHSPNTYIQSPCLPTNNSITECWLGVVEFITWYNKQPAQ